MTPERVEALLESAVAHTGGTHTVADVVDQLSKGALQLWIGAECIGVTEIQNFPRKRTLNVFLAAGDMREFVKLQPGMEAFGRGRGASTFTFLGRATRAVRKRCGWVRSGEGFEAGWVLYSKEI